MAGYTWYAGTLRDGRITTRLDGFGGSWSKVMDDAGALQLTMALGDPAVAATNPRLVAEPCRCFLAVAYVDDDGTETFLQGGPVWTHAYDGGSKQLTLGASGIWSYYDHRKILPVLAANQGAQSVNLVYTASLGTIAKNLIQLAHTHTGGSVPIVLPADEAGTIVRQYFGYDMNIVGQALRDLTAVQGGPEIQFVPRRTAADPRYIEWAMRTGTTAAPLLVQAGSDWVWDASVPKSSVSAISVASDGSAMGSRQWVQGAGSDTSTIFGQANETSLIDAGFPLLENADTSNHTDVQLETTLGTWAAGELAKSDRPVESWTVTVNRDDTPAVSQYSVGDWEQLTVARDPYITDGTYRSRITQISGDDSNQVQLQLAPTLAAV